MISRLLMFMLIACLAAACGFNGVVIEESSEIVEVEEKAALTATLKRDTLSARANPVQQFHTTQASF